MILAGAPWSDVSLENPVISGLIAVAAVLTAWYVIWKRAFVPLGRFIRAVDEIAAATPVLVEIAHEFRPNDGQTLRDTVDRVEAGMLEAIRLGRVNEDHLIESGERLHDSWTADRDRILAALAVIEDRQTRFASGVAQALSSGGDLQDVRDRVIAALELPSPGDGAEKSASESSSP